MQYSILIAEDDLDIQSLLKLYLGNAGFRVFTADNGRSALSILQEEHIDLALLDIMMPEANGYQVMEELRKTSNIPVLFLSAKDQDYDRILGLNLGADAYLTKPFNPLEVVAQVQAALRRFYRLGSGEQHEGTVFRLGALTLDLERMRLLKEGRTVDLTPTEFRVLSRMMQSSRRRIMVLADRIIWMSLRFRQHTRNRKAYCLPTWCSSFPAVKRKKRIFSVNSSSNAGCIR